MALSETQISCTSSVSSKEIRNISAEDAEDAEKARNESQITSASSASSAANLKKAATRTEGSEVAEPRHMPHFSASSASFAANTNKAAIGTEGSVVAERCDTPPLSASSASSAENLEKAATGTEGSEVATPRHTAHFSASFASFAANTNKAAIGTEGSEVAEHCDKPGFSASSASFAANTNKTAIGTEGSVVAERCDTPPLSASSASSAENIDKVAIGTEDSEVEKHKLAPSISFEFFPPRNAEQRLVLESTWQKLATLGPEYLSVTFGAGGSTQSQTRATVEALLGSTSVPVAPHISCMAPSEEKVEELLRAYLDLGVDRLVVLRGDRPAGQRGPGPFQYANQLVSWIRKKFGDSFLIHVACYPECHPDSVSVNSELRHFCAKVEAGADVAITQYFYNAESYFQFVEDVRGEGIDIPIVPGIMPITNYRQLSRFSDMCGAEIPQWIRKRLESFGDDGASIRAFGLEVVAKMCDRLLAEGAPGLHIYTLNRANASMLLWQRLTRPGKSR